MSYPDHTIGDATESANAALRRIWVDTIRAGDWPQEIPHRWPMQYSPLHPGRLLFVGLNPSYSQRAARAGDDTSLHDVSDLTDIDRIRRCLDADARWRSPEALYPYFKPFNEFGLQWEHADIFAIRERDQARVRDSLSLQEDGNWTPFAERQYQIFESLLASVQPIGVVVVNALGSTLLVNRWRRSNRLQPAEHAARGLLNTGTQRIPVYFSGMLSGQRAMDRFSRARLVHEVRNALAGGR